ncbi:VCBS domain-containing protein, partial [Bradyrhizobium sp.]|uniref:VCBS domain-containing protein n=1 Tax=Bradyrhizobium sp. TaxID=376 RepID=UPI001D8CE2C8
MGWTFTLNNNSTVLQSLAVGQTITQVYTVTIIDNNGAAVTQDVTVTIAGTNDDPVIISSAGDASGAVTEDTNPTTLTTGGTLSIRDLDLIDTHGATAVFLTSSSNAHLPGFSEGTTNIGSFAIDPSVTESNGDTDNTATLGWTFTLADDDPMLQSLAAGQIITQVYRVTFTDNNGATVTQDVTVTITGSNDSPNHAPTIIGELTTATGAVTEDAATPTLSTGGIITFRDVDLIDTHTAGFVLKSTDATADLPGFAEDNSALADNIGTFALTPATVVGGTVVEFADTNNTATVGWTFTLNNNSSVLQSLAAGQTITQVYTVTITDNNLLPVTQDVTVTITGTNDAPEIVGALTTDSGEVTEDAATPTLTTGGTITFQDVDLIDTHTAGFVLKSTDASADLPGFAEGISALADNIGTFAIDLSVT